MLVVLGRIADAGASFPLLIRLPASLADLVSTVVLFHLLRGLRGDAAAAAAAVVFSLSPLAVIVSGFHGNTDPVFVMFVLLSVLALTRGDGWWAGVAFGLALSVNVVPVVALPVLLVLAWRLGRPVLQRFLLGGTVVFALLWVPVLIAEPGPFVSHVLGYSGISIRQWGLSQLLSWSGLSSSTVVQVGDGLRFALLAVAALLPAHLARRRPWGEAVALAGLPLCLFLVLSPAFSMQYLVWALAPVLLAVPLRVAVSYVALASGYAVVVYSGWNGAWPWGWYEAVSTPQPTVVLPLMLLVWLALVRACWIGATDPTPDPATTPHGELTHAH
jgi:4-amino-4-deoxy-L-arabinose transferase-like glycosyltransferase